MANRLQRSVRRIDSSSAQRNAYSTSSGLRKIHQRPQVPPFIFFFMCANIKWHQTERFQFLQLRGFGQSTYSDLDRPSRHSDEYAAVISLLQDQVLQPVSFEHAPAVLDI